MCSHICINNKTYVALVWRPEHETGRRCWSYPQRCWLCQGFAPGSCLPSSATGPGIHRPTARFKYKQYFLKELFEIQISFTHCNPIKQNPSILMRLYMQGNACQTLTAQSVKQYSKWTLYKHTGSQKLLKISTICSMQMLISPSL